MLSLLLAILSLPYLFRIGAVFLFAIAQKNVPLHRKMCNRSGVIYALIAA